MDHGRANRKRNQAPISDERRVSALSVYAGGGITGYASRRPSPGIIRDRDAERSRRIAIVVMARPARPAATRVMSDVKNSMQRVWTRVAIEL